MELNNDFRVGVDRATTWKVLTDLERIAPLLPGAQLQEVEGEEYRGIIKVKVGPIQAQYKGTATLIETDESAGKMVMKATGRDTRGQGNASATITLVMTTDGDGTKVTANTDLTISGKVAQFGRGVLADVSSKLIGQFVDNLEKDLNSGAKPAGDEAPSGSSSSVPSPPPGSPPSVSEASGSVPDSSDLPAARAETNGSITAGSGSSDDAASASSGSGTPTEPSGPRKIDSPEPDPVDLFDAAGNTVVKRFAPLVGGALLVLLAIVLRRRRRASRRVRAQARVTSTVSAMRERVSSVNLPAISLPAVDDVVTAGRKAGRRAAKNAARAGHVVAQARVPAISLPAVDDAVTAGRKAGRRAAKKAAKVGHQAAQRVR